MRALTVFREKVMIPETKPFIFVRGNGKGRTSINHESASSHNAESAAFTVHADNVIVFGLSIRVRPCFSLCLCAQCIYRCL
jgi:hypothetical protein